MNSIAKSVRTTAQIALAGVLALGVAPPTSPAAAADGALTPAELGRVLSLATGTWSYESYLLAKWYTDPADDTPAPELDLGSTQVRFPGLDGNLPFESTRAVIISGTGYNDIAGRTAYVEVAIDTNYDDTDDLYLPNYFVDGALIHDVTSVHRYQNGDWVDTGQPAVWQQLPYGHAAGAATSVAFDWRALGIDALRPAFLLQDETDNYDWSPDGYEGLLLELPLPPAAPRNVSAIPGSQSAVVTWTPPADSGSYHVEKYILTASPTGKTCIPPAGITSCTISGLAKGSTHTFSVVATSAAGKSPESAPSAAITIPKEPSAPLGVVAQAGDGAATVAWSSPADPGSHPVTSYTATAAPGGATCSTAGTTCTITGLVNGRAYTFTVVARSEAGSSPPSLTSAAVTPRKVKVVQEQPPPKAVVKVRARKAKSVLFVNVNPDKGRGFWKFRVQKKSGATTWKNLKAYKTQGPKETRTIDLPRGKYRVVVKAKYGHEGATSRVVRLLR